MATKRNRRDFTREEAACLLSYDPESGKIHWVVDRLSYGGKAKAGTVAGQIHDGYVIIGLLGKQYRAHHLAWLMMTGEWPPLDLDVEHQDRNRSNNAWTNLRLATRYQNIANVGTRSTNKSGRTGVSWRKDTGKWHARIKADGKIILLGNFVEFEDACRARAAAEAIHHGEFAAA